MSTPNRKEIGILDARAAARGVRRCRRRQQHLAARHSYRPHREQPLHARRGHARRARRHRRADQSLFLLLERGDRAAARRCARTPTRVREMLEEFAAQAPDGKLVLHVVDPLPFSEDEDRAEQFGLQGADVGHGRRGRLLRPGGLQQRRHDGPDPVLRPDPRRSVPRVRPRQARLQPREPRQDGRRLADERARRRRLQPADATADAGVGHRRASEAAARGADAAGERAHDRATTSTCSGSCIRTMLDEGTLYAIDQFVHARRARARSSWTRTPRFSRARTRRGSGSAARLELDARAAVRGVGRHLRHR